MSIALVEDQIRRFLSSNRSEVICISGHWGVGKTFAWNRLLREARGQIALKRYSYVSLFGVNSLDDFKYSIFENSVQSSQAGVEVSLKTVQSNAKAVADHFGRRSLRFLQQVPLVKNYVGGLGPLWFLSVNETVVCVDDIERKGKDLSVRDILGLISQVKEQKRCKVCLILNDEALEGDKVDFEKYLEKTVDTKLKFAPSAEECARIALDKDTETGKMLAENCMALDIRNIRLIKRIERAVDDIEILLKGFDEAVLRKAVQSLTLLGWSVYEPTTAPPLDFLKGRVEALLPGKEKGTVSDKEAAWNALLDSVLFFGVDEFDLVLLDGISNGFFDPSLIRKHAEELHRKAKAAKSDNSWEEAWRAYHDSFSSNEQQVADSIYESFRKDVQHRSLLDLNASVGLLKELGRPEQADETISLYIASRGENRDAFDLDDFPFKNKINDPDVVRALREKYASFPEEEGSPSDILISIAERHGWSEKEMKVLSALSVEKYCAIFKGHEGQKLHRIINASFQLGGEASRRAKEALKLIGKESRINAMRVRRYGVEVDPGGDGEAV